MFGAGWHVHCKKVFISALPLLHETFKVFPLCRRDSDLSMTTGDNKNLQEFKSNEKDFRSIYDFGIRRDYAAGVGERSDLYDAPRLSQRTFADGSSLPDEKRQPHVAV